jgi:PKD repeat protein
VDAGVDLRAYVGQAVSLTARVAPPGANPSSYRWTLAWGDASVDSGDVGSAGLISASHTYAAVGRYAVSLTGRASTGTTGNDTVTVIVEAAGTPQVFIGAGDIGECGLVHARKTAEMIDTIPGTVFTLGDNAYPRATATDYANCYAPTWGRFKKRTRPVPGNHEFQEYTHDTTADGYFSYFGIAAGVAPVGLYSFDLGAWHIVVLNSSFEESQAAGRALSRDNQLTWLRNDLTAHPALCTLAMWHHPRFSSGTTHGNDTLQQPFWQALYDANADVILVGHEHNYERFAPQTPNGTLDNARGIREFVVGTGGGGYDSLDAAKVGLVANSEVGAMEHGVLKLTLFASSYHWEFLQELPPLHAAFSDSGTASCH